MPNVPGPAEAQPESEGVRDKNPRGADGGEQARRSQLSGGVPGVSFADRDPEAEED